MRIDILKPKQDWRNIHSFKIISDEALNFDSYSFDSNDLLIIKVPKEALRRNRIAGLSAKLNELGIVHLIIPDETTVKHIPDLKSLKELKQSFINEIDRRALELI